MDAYPEAFKRLEGPIQLGTTTITFRARSPNSNLNEICRTTVVAVAQQPPEVVYCPESFVVQLDEGETARLVYWKEPAFRAIGHLKQLYKSRQPGDKFTIGEHYVSYVATDAEGQSSKCNFKVTVKGMSCIYWWSVKQMVGFYYESTGYKIRLLLLHYQPWLSRGGCRQLVERKLDL